MTVIGSMRLR